ncbi:hypothetical protein [Methanolobus sp.]|jgi:hypothetical protein|uniref:hypothetical protein n=1 Tax=Methanolobus sp. TaxID=1874737 RepID=UPI0025CCC19D|nr:hypothetical protein [Methanolobus sp.]
MIYGEMDFLGIIDIPRINTMFCINNARWNQWKVTLNDEYLEIQTSCNILTIKFEDILIVDRILPQAILSKIQNSSKYSSVIAIDYKKDATFGTGKVVDSMILAGKKSNIFNLKYLLMSLLGVKADPLIGNMNPQDIRLLFLLASGINSMEMLLPICDGNQELINKTFASLKTKKLVDEYATVTSLGTEMIDRMKGIEKKNLGSNVLEDYEDVSTMWNCLDTMKVGNEETIRTMWKCGGSALYGDLAIEDIKRFISCTFIKEIRLKNPENTSTMDLDMTITDGSKILLRSRDYSILIALYGILNKEEDIQIRILFCFYLGYTIEPDVLRLLDIPLPLYENHFKILASSSLINVDSKELTNAGVNLVSKKIIGDVSVLFKWVSFEYKAENFKRIENSRMACAKKKVLDILQNKYDQRNNLVENPRS